MKIHIENTRTLGVMPGSNPPELAWHEFRAFDDGVEHHVNDVLRASIPAEHFQEYFDAQDSVTGVVFTQE